jgi:hypothetical protein
VKRLLLFLWLCTSWALAQQPVPPLPIPLKLKGNYGELRSNHFHSGLDFSTQGKIGIPVIAAFDGYVSRIKADENGFGKVIYMNHDNGKTTVYAHLHRFGKETEALINAEQLQKKKYSVELFPEKNSVFYKKGDTIAWSGNSGSSAGPHLHFEIRNSQSEKPENPICYFLQIKDTIPPVIKSIALYSIKDQFRQIELLEQIVPMKKEPATYKLSSVMKASSPIGIGFSAYDLANDDSAILGVDEVALYVNDKLVYSRKMNDFAFDETKNINGLIDYSLKQTRAEQVERCYRLPGNTFSQYGVLLDEGLIRMDQLKTASCLLQLRDGSGNTATCSFTILNDSSNVKPRSFSKKDHLFYYNKNNQIKTEQFSLTLPGGALFRDIYFDYSIKNGRGKYFSPVITLHSEQEPLKKNATFKISSYPLNDNLKAKLVLVKIAANKSLSPVAGEFSQGYFTASINSFGTYALTLDTIAPVCEKWSVYYDSTYASYALEVRVNDDLSGIVAYQASLNNQWIMSEYDKKENRIIVLLPREWPAQAFVRLELTDARQNRVTSEQLLKDIKIR